MSFVVERISCWELLRCEDCGHERSRQRLPFRTMLSCPHCHGKMARIPLIAIESAVGDRDEEFTVDDAASALWHAAEQERAGAAAELDRMRRERREGRAEAFREALDILAAAYAADPLRTATEAAG